MRFLPAGLDAVLVEVDGLEDTLALQETLVVDPIAGMIEAILGARTVLIRFQPLLRPSWHDIVVSLRGRDLGGRSRVEGRSVTIPVLYDGEDLETVATFTGLAADEVIVRHAASRFTVAFTGFAPGFAYLTGGDPKLAVPRRQSPRARIPKGSVALAGPFSGVYPKASPGGWQIIGTTPLDMFDLDRSPASLLEPGMNVRFSPVSNRADYERLLPVAKRKFSDPQGDRAGTNLTVTTAPVVALWQDLGRPGLTAQGISASGALDRGALRQANSIVGNDESEACLEFAGGRLGFTVSGPAIVAVTGAPCAIEIRPASGRLVRSASGRAVALDAGDTVTIIPGVSGARSYLAARGGFVVAPVLGSASTDTLAEIGPPAIGAGAEIGLRARRGGTAIDPCPVPEPDLPRPGETVAIDVILGPRTQLFTDEALDRLTGSDWTVTPRSNRVGLRLSGSVGLEKCDPGAELPSEATVRGAIQVPHDGQPIVFLADHPLTIGYPVIATIAGHHLDLAGQLPAGAMIRFRAMGPFADIASQPKDQTP